MPANDTSAASFQLDVLAVKNIPVLVDFWAPWCGPCRQQGPILDQLADEAGEAVKIFKVNVDQEGDLAQRYGIMSIPALKIFKDGKLVEEMVGVHSKEQLLETIEKHS